LGLEGLEVAGIAVHLQSKQYLESRGAVGTLPRRGHGPPRKIVLQAEGDVSGGETMADRDLERSIDWPAVITLLASAGLLVIGLLLNAIDVKSGLKAALLIGVFATTSAVAAALAASRTVSSSSRRLGASLDRQIQDLKTEISAHIARLESNLGMRLETTEADASQSWQKFRGDVVASLQMVEHTVLDYLVAKPKLGDSRAGQVTQIDITQVTVIEEHASEVWVYAVDLRWDAESMFSRVMELNLHEKVRYRYMVPGTNEALAGVSAIRRRLRGVPDLDRFLTFKVREEKYPLGLVGFSIYNPTYEKSKDEIEKLRASTCMVQFPRLSDTDPDSSFVRLSGTIVREHEMAFYRLWNSAKPYRAER
jgi:hypothetical protein